MTELEVLRQFQGERTRAQYAEQLGVSVKLLDAVFSGERRVTEALLVRLVRAYPDAKDQVSELLFFEAKYRNSDEAVASVVDSQEHSE